MHNLKRITAAVFFFFAASAFALDSADLLFHLSFDDGLEPEFARGSGAIARRPAETSRRLVEGLWGKGYLFAGKDSTIEYFTGGKGGRNCWEAYGLKANLFGDAGTLSFWFKPLPNTHNMAHAFFRCDNRCWIQVFRDQNLAYSFCYSPRANRGGGLYDQPLRFNQWHHLALTWRKDEARGYFDGARMNVARETGVLAETPERFIVAAEGLRWLDSQKKDFEDDTVLDELQLFRRPLTDEEIRGLFERGHVAVDHQNGVGVITCIKPEREYAGHLLGAPLVGASIKADGDLSDWKAIPGHGCFLERRLGVLDTDPGRIYAACDRQNLYLGFSCEVDESIQKDPTHIWYPAGQFKADATGRDADVDSDDYVEFALKGKDGHEYRFALNAKGALTDRRDGDQQWNGKAAWSSRSDFKDWTAELAVPLAELGLAVGDTVAFNAARSWKLFKSAQNSFCADVHARPAFGKLTLGAPSVAALDGLGQPWRGHLAVTGSVGGAPGEYTVKVRGKGFAEEKKVAVEKGKGLTRFEIKRRLERPDDMAVVAEVIDPNGKPVLTRTIPFAYSAASNVELINYPGWGRLDVAVTPIGADIKGLRAAVEIFKVSSESVLRMEIPQFDDPSKTVRFETKQLPIGKYEVVTKLVRGRSPRRTSSSTGETPAEAGDDQLVAEDRQPYEKKPLPEWYRCKAGEIAGPPIPWTDVRVEGHAVKLLIKEIAFDQTLFPARIVSNNQELLARPIGLRVKRKGEEKLLTSGEFAVTEKTRRRASWVSKVQDGDLQVQVRGWIEFDGFTWVDVELSGGTVDWVAWEIPLRKDCVTLKTIGSPLLDGKPQDLPVEYGSYWFGNEKAGLQYWWEHRRGWVPGSEPGKMTPSDKEVVLSMPFIQKPVDLSQPRTITFGWAITPSKPLRRDWRHILIDRGGVFCNYNDYAAATPNYAKPREKPEWYQQVREAMKKNEDPIGCVYAYGPFMWVGAPEYAEWHREWSYTPDAVKPDPNSQGWGPACHRSSASDLQIWLLDQYVKEYPQRGIYLDCMWGDNFCKCGNEAHGCGYVDENGVRQPISTLLAARRHYERIYNILKAADPVYGWVRFHDWGPNMALAPFCDDNWVGEGMLAAIAGSPGKNYYPVVDIPTARQIFGNEHWGHFTGWLTEIGKYGRMVRPPRATGDHDPGEWAYPPEQLQDHEHVAGLALLHDTWQVGGNSLDLPWQWAMEIARLMRWDETVRFAGYWELGDLVDVKGGLPEKIVCSVYHRPDGLEPPKTDAVSLVSNGESWRRFTVKDEIRSFLRAVGGSKDGWLILTPMNNTDQDATISLKPNFAKLRVKCPANARLRDVYRAFDYSWRGPECWRVDANDPCAPTFPFKGREEVFPLKQGTAQVTIPKRNFRMLLLEGTQASVISNPLEIP